MKLSKSKFSRTLGIFIIPFFVTLPMLILLSPTNAFGSHETNKAEVRRELSENDGGNWIVIYSKEFSHQEYLKLAAAIAADVATLGADHGAVTTVYFSNFAVESRNKVLQESAEKAPSITDQIRRELTLNKVLSAVRASFKGGTVDISIGGMKFQVGNVSYNRAECTKVFGKKQCIPTPNTHQPYIRFKVLQSQVSPPPATEGNGFIKLRNKSWNTCLNLQSATQNGVTTNSWECVSHPDQEWKIEDAGNGFVKLRNKSWNTCLNLQSATQNGVTTNSWECVSHPDQEWKIEDAGNGFVKLRNKSWNTCLNLQSATQNGVTTNSWECVSHPDQEWKIENTR